MKKIKGFVITADVINSKTYDTIEEVIKEKLDKVNAVFSNELYAKFTALKGDEFQAIVRKEHAKSLLKVIRELKHQMGDYKIRIGVGYGAINDGGNLDEKFGSWGLNGEAFYKARFAVDELRSKKRSTIKMSTKFKMFDNDLKDQTINLLYYSVDKVLSKWSEEKWIITKYLEEKKTHEEIARIMNAINNQNKERESYTKKINRSEWYFVQEVEKLIIKMFVEGL